MTARLDCIVVAVLMLASFAQALASETDYRLAGIVAGFEGSMALIELPDGRQRLFRTGDALGDGRVREITSIGVRIELAQEDLLLRLRGNPRLVASPRPEAPTDDDEEDPEQSRVRNQQVSVPEAARLLASARRANESQPGAPPPSAEALREQLNALLEMPDGAQISAVDDVRVETPEDAIEALVSRLDRSGETRLTVSGAGALETIVLAPDAEQ